MRSPSFVWARAPDLDLRLGQGGVVDADLVDGAGEVLPKDAVAADLELIVGRGDAAGGCRARDLGPIDEQPDRGAVVGGGQVRERVRGDRDRAGRLPVHARDRCPANGSGGAPGTGGRGDYAPYGDKSSADGKRGG
jgi:hypothetical protein